MSYVCAYCEDEFSDNVMCPECVDGLRADLAEARRVLKLVEWIGDDQMPHCHVCDVERWDGAGGKHGHAPDCALAKALEEGG